MILLHGWGGGAGQLGALVEPLVHRGHEVIAFDAPGHGASAGRLSSVVEFADALLAIQAEVGDVRGVVAHSLGGAATALALERGLRVERVVLFSPPAGPVDWTRLFAECLSVPDAVMTRMRARVGKRLGVLWTDLDVVDLAARQATPLLLIHDEGDPEVPVNDGRAIAAAWPGARFLGTQGLGHWRILREEPVVAEAVAFIASRAVPRPSGMRAPLPVRRDSTALLEEDLYCRDVRSLRGAEGVLRLRFRLAP